MSACRAMLSCTAVFVASLASGSDDALEPTGADTAAGENSTSPSRLSRGPRLHPQLSERAASRVDSAIPVAHQRLRDHRSCRALFANLGADGVAMPDATSYYPASVKEERRYCRGSSYAPTRVGSPAVRLCRSFGRLSDQQAAIILIATVGRLSSSPHAQLDAAAIDNILDVAGGRALHALSLEGEELWRRELDSDVAASVTVEDEVLYVHPSTGLHAFGVLRKQ